METSQQRVDSLVHLSDQMYLLSWNKKIGHELREVDFEKKILQISQKNLKTNEDIL